MDSVEATGSTIEEAKDKALKELNIKDPEKVKWEILEEPASGIFGIGSKEAKVRATIKEAGDIIDKTPESQNFEQNRSLFYDKAKEVLQEIIQYMGIQVELKEQKQEDKIIIDIKGKDVGILIGKWGQTLKALQFLVNIIVNKSAETRQKVLLDAEGYLSRREAALKDLALGLASRAVKENKSIDLDPMTPNERRIVHLALADHPQVETQSTGEGPERKIVIIPKSDRL